MIIRLSPQTPSYQHLRDSVVPRVSFLFGLRDLVFIYVGTAQFIEELPESTMENVEVYTKGYYARFQPQEQAN